jgi:hypothetical protein
VTTGRDGAGRQSCRAGRQARRSSVHRRRSRLSDIGFGLLGVSVGQTRKLGAGELGIRCCNRARRLHRRVVHRADRSRAVNPRVCPEPAAPSWIDLTEANEEAS